MDGDGKSSMMDESPPNQERSSLSLLVCKLLKAIQYDKIKTDVGHIIQITGQLAQEDPRRIVHSFKVGVAITLVSLFYYFEPLYQGFGVSAMWAVLTVVVVFEYSVGATLGKGVNRVLATILGGMSAVGAHRLSSLPGKKLEPVFLALSVFITAGVTTFIRFFPKMKARFDYGLLVFILTFCLISVSGYRDDEVINMAHTRITTLLIGSSTAVFVCAVICPVWAGTDLHKLVATNVLTLSLFFLGFEDEYFKISSDTASNDNRSQDGSGLKYLLDSKNNIDSLLTFVKWEPRHGQFKKDHPWTQYQKIGELARHCAYRAEALHGFLYSDHQAPKEVKDKFREACTKMSIESGKALNELALAIRKMTQPSKARPHLQNAKNAAHDLDLLLKASTNIWKNLKLNLSDVTPAATVATLLVDVVGCTEEIAEAVQQLASQAKFKTIMETTNKVAPPPPPPDPEFNKIKATCTNQGSIKRRSVANHMHVVTIDPAPAASPKASVSKDPPSLAMAQQTGE